MLAKQTHMPEVFAQRTFEFAGRVLMHVVRVPRGIHIRVRRGDEEDPARSQDSSQLANRLILTVDVLDDFEADREIERPVLVGLVTEVGAHYVGVVAQARLRGDDSILGYVER